MTHDASGNLACRAPTSSTTCAGSATGAQLSYDAEGRLSAWQSAPSSPNTTASFLYNGAGHRVAQQTSSGGTTTTYVSNVEELTTSGTSRPPTTVGDPLADGVDVSALIAWSAALLASLHPAISAAAVTAVTHYVPPTYYFANSGSGGDVMRHIAREYSDGQCVTKVCINEFAHGKGSWSGKESFGQFKRIASD